MATDARISTGLPAHPKTKKLVRQLGAEAGWSLVVLILWAAANRSDGDLSGMTDEDIELAADWDGEPGAFIGALRRIRFIDGEEGASHVHDWTEHQPWAAGSEARSLKAKWNAVKRFHGESEADRQVPEYARIRHDSSKQDVDAQHATSMHAASKQHADSKQDSCSSPIRLLSESSPTPTLETARKRAARKCPESFAITPDLEQWAAENAQGVDLKRETDKFRDHTFKTAHSDWVGAWRNWIRRAAESLPRARASPPATETAYQRSMREKVAAICPSIAAKPPNHSETFDVTAKTLGREDLCEVDADLRAGVPLSLGGS